MLTEVLYTSTKRDREQLARDIKAALEPLGIKVEARTLVDPRTLNLDIGGAGLSAMVTIRPDNEVPLIHWYGARAWMVYNPAWGQPNPHHGSKATSLPFSFIDLIEKLQRGFSAAADGSAFRVEACSAAA